MRLTDGAEDPLIQLPVDPATGEGPGILGLAVVPGSPRTLVIVISAHGTETVEALDDAVARAATVQGSYGGPIQFDGPSTIYLLGGLNALNTLVLTASGVGTGTVGPASNLFSSASELLFDGELAFGNDGHVVDPRRGVLLGSYNVIGEVAVDRAGGRSYVSIPANADAHDYRLVFAEYDRTAFTRLRTLTLTLQGTPGYFVRAIDGTLAVAGLVDVTPGYDGVALVRPDAWQAATTP